VRFLVNQYYFRMKRLQTGDEHQQPQVQGGNKTTLVDHHRNNGEMPPNKIQKKSTNKDEVPYEPLVSEGRKNDISLICFLFLTLGGS
jgi:hypothetical protein